MLGFFWQDPNYCYHGAGIRFFICCNPFAAGLPGVSVVKNPPANEGDVDSIPESGRSLGEGKGNSILCSCLKNPVDRGA